MSNRKQRKDIDKAVRNLINFAEQQSPWRERLDEMFSGMLSPVANSLQIAEDDLIVELQEGGLWHMVFGYVFEEFAAAIWDDEAHSFIAEYLKRRGWREAARGRRYWQAIDDSEVQLWEITAVNPGHHADVRLYGSRDKPVRVKEASATQSLRQWDCLAGRVIRLDDTPLFSGALLSLPPSEAARVQRVLDRTKKETIKLFKEMQKTGELEEMPADLEQMAEDEAHTHLPDILFRIWAVYVYQATHHAMPAMQNMDGEDFQPVKVRFTIKSPADTLCKALDALPELDRTEDAVWAWFPCHADEIKEGEPTRVLGHLLLRDSALELEVNSTERAQRGSQWLATQLGGLIGPPLTIHENPADCLESASSLDGGMDLSATEEGQAIIKAQLDKHYRQTLDESVPMLNDQTPRECAADPNLHSIVVEWLKYLENQSVNAPSNEYDFTWIWQELGLDRYKQ